MTLRRRIAATTASTAMTGVFFLGPLGFATPAASADDTCSDLVIGVGGNGQRYAESNNAVTMIGLHLDAEAAKGNRVESLDYESSVWPTGPYTKDESVRDGNARLTQLISDYRQECPNGHVKIIAHSLGAELDTSGADEVVLYGDSRSPRGIYTALPGVYPGATNPGPRVPGANEVSVCHEFDGICDSVAPWSDPAKFVQGVAGYLTGWHNYQPGEADGRDPGFYLIAEPAPLPWLPESTPTGIPAAPPLALPEWTPGPMPSTQDVFEFAQAVTPKPYAPTPIRDYVPVWAEPVLPPEVLDFVPGPLPEVVLPPLPDLGIRLP